ncbi:MAG: type VII toxin-antitoxin system HepT family RNase toxin [Bacillota bacterium]
MLDKSVIMARLARLDEYAARLRRFEGVNLEEYTGDYDIQAIVERNLQLAIQVCMDIANYIIARKKLSFPADQENIFTLLGREGIIPGELANRIKGMVNFRNILVHDYTEIDPKRVHGTLKQGLKDFNDFAAAAVRFLERD